MDISFAVGTDAKKIKRAYDDICKADKVDMPSTVLWHGSASAYPPHFHVRLNGQYAIGAAIGTAAPCTLDGVKL